MTTGRTLAAVLAAVSAAVMGLSVWRMASRVSAYYEATGHRLYVFREVQDRAFRFAGRPVTIADTDNPPGVIVRYGDRELPIPATREPKSIQLPGLARHADWLRVLRFAERDRMTSDELERAIDEGRVADRLVIVVLDPRRWADGRPLGEGQATDALFTLHELVPDGSIRTEQYSFPLSARAAAAKPPAWGPKPLPEDTWQYYASLWLMPRGSKPTPRFTTDAVRSLGWTLPTAAFSGLVLTLCLPFALAPRRKPPAAESAGPAAGHRP
ncbi:MAG: hypothetical protein IT437_01875 [Phycisphaerales bacterium]|nr:hypothetical protein [Phycisphaerales bacterium]